LFRITAFEEGVVSVEYYEFFHVNKGRITTHWPRDMWSSDFIEKQTRKYRGTKYK